MSIFEPTLEDRLRWSLELANRAKGVSLITTWTQLAIAIENDDDDVCRKCGGPNNNGEGFDGLCGTCADRAEYGERADGENQ